MDSLPNPYVTHLELVKLSFYCERIQYQTTRGCAFSCSYCDTGRMKAKTLSLDRIKSDLSYFSSIDNIKHIDILDGTLNYNLERFRAILEHIISLNSPWSIHSEIRPELLRDREAELLHNANFKSVELGLQSIHKKTLKKIKRGFRESSFKRAVCSLQKNKIEVMIDTIIALPGECIEEWFQTLDFCFSLGKVSIISNVLKILPNTNLFNNASKYEYKIDKLNSNVVVSSSGFSKSDISKAVLINKLVDIFWNKSNYPDTIIIISKQVFSGKTHLLFIKIVDMLSRNIPLTKDDDFKRKLLKNTVHDLNISDEEKLKFTKQIDIDF